MTHNVHRPRSPSLQPPTAQSPGTQPPGLPAGARVLHSATWSHAASDGREDIAPGRSLPSRKPTLKRDREEEPADPDRHREPGEGASDKKCRHPTTTPSPRCDRNEHPTGPTPVTASEALTREQAEAFIVRKAGEYPVDIAAQAAWCDAVICAAIDQLDGDSIRQVSHAMFARMCPAGADASARAAAARLMAHRIGSQALPFKGAANAMLAPLLDGLVRESGEHHAGHLASIASGLHGAACSLHASRRGAASLGALLALALGGPDIRPFLLAALLAAMAPCGTGAQQRLPATLALRYGEGGEGFRIGAMSQFLAILEAIRPADGGGLAPARWTAVTHHLTGPDMDWGGAALSQLLRAAGHHGPVPSLLGEVLHHPRLDRMSRGQACAELGMAWLAGQGRPLARKPIDAIPHPPLADAIDTDARNYLDLLRELVVRACAEPQPLVALTRLGQGLAPFLASVDLQGALPWVVRHAGLAPTQVLALLMGQEEALPSLESFLSTPRGDGPDDETLLALHALGESLAREPVDEWIHARRDRSRFQVAWDLLPPAHRRELLLARAAIIEADLAGPLLQPRPIGEMSDKQLRQMLEPALRASRTCPSGVDVTLLCAGLVVQVPVGGGQRRILEQALRALLSQVQDAPNTTLTTRWAARVVLGLMLAAPAWRPHDSLQGMLGGTLRGSAVAWEQGMVHLLAAVAHAIRQDPDDPRADEALRGLLEIALAEYRPPGLPGPVRPLLGFSFLADHLGTMTRPGREAAESEPGILRCARVFFDVLRRTVAVHGDPRLAVVAAAWIRGATRDLPADAAPRVRSALVDFVLQGSGVDAVTGLLATGILVGEPWPLQPAGDDNSGPFAPLVLGASHLPPRQLARVLLAYGAAYPLAPTSTPALTATRLAQAGHSRQQVRILAFWHAQQARGAAVMPRLAEGAAVPESKSGGGLQALAGVETPQALMAAWEAGWNLGKDPIRTLRAQRPSNRHGALDLLLTMGQAKGQLDNAASLLHEVMGWTGLEAKLEAILQLVAAPGIRLRTVDFQALRKRLTQDIQALLDADPTPDSKTAIESGYREVVAGRTLQYRQTRERYEDASSRLTAAYQKLPRAFGEAYQHDPLSAGCEALEGIHAFLVEELLDVSRPGVPDMIARPVMRVLERESQAVMQALDRLASAPGAGTSTSITTASSRSDPSTLDD